MPRTKTDQQPKALTADTPVENKEALTECKDPNVRSSTRFFLSDKGELAMTFAGSKRIEKAFLGSNVESESTTPDSKSLDILRLSQVVRTLPYAPGKGETPEAMNLALDGVAALAPRDGMEVMLCSQLVALHSQSMEFLRRGMLPDQTTEGVDCNVNRATKLLRSFATITECLRTYRGGGQQKMTVEHVTVQAGGRTAAGCTAGALRGPAQRRALSDQNRLAGNMADLHRRGGEKPHASGSCCGSAKKWSGFFGGKSGSLRTMK